MLLRTQLNASHLHHLAVLHWAHHACLTVLARVCCRLDENSDAEQEDYEEKLKELEDVANPVVSKVPWACSPCHCERVAAQGRLNVCP
jgi:hypothetical protein